MHQEPTLSRQTIIRSPKEDQGLQRVQVCLGWHYACTGYAKQEGKPLRPCRACFDFSGFNQ